MTHPLDVAVVIGLVPLGVISMLAQAAAPTLPDHLTPWLQLGGSASLIAALVVAVKYQTARGREALNEIKQAHQERVTGLEKDKEYYRKRCEELTERVLHPKSTTSV